MSVQQTIEQKLTQEFESGHLVVENESHMHSVPPNSETHFKVTLISSAFEEQSRVKRHQSVYKVLADEMAGPVHALALHLFTPAEWEQRGEAATQSPNCMGGSTHDPASKA